MSSIFFGITTRTFHYSHTIGRAEYSGPGFRHPMDLALDSEDVMYVPSRSREDRPDGVRVTVCTIEEDYLRQFGQYGELDGEFIWPASITVDDADNVYVLDQWLNRVSIFNKDGDFLDKWGIQGTGAGQMNQPSGMELDPDQNLYVVDSQNCRVQKFTRDGRFLTGWGEEGSGPGQFSAPWGIDVDAEGRVYVADWRNDRVQKFGPEGEFLAEFGSPGTGIGQLNRPAGVGVDRDGDIYVADWGNHRVQVMTPDGRHITTFTGDSEMSKWGQAKLDANPDMRLQRDLVRDRGPERAFWYPVAVVFDRDGRVLVSDCQRHRVQVYQKGVG